VHSGAAYRTGTAGRAQPMLPGMAAAQQAHTENTLMASSNLRD